MSSYTSKLHKFSVCKFSEISIDRKKNVQRSIIVHDRIPDESQMPEVCSVQSIPSLISSLEGTYHEWISTVSFDEMLKLSSSSSSSYIDCKEVHYDFKSFIEKNSLEFQLCPLKFNDLVHKLQKIVHSPQTDQKSDTEFQRTMQTSPTSSKLSFLSRRKESHATCAKNAVQYKVEKCLKSKRADRMTDSLVIVKPSCDPQREFKESMMEMIAENKIKDGKDLEELLAWFLYMNSEDYHEVIIQVFKQIWTELNHV